MSWKIVVAAVVVFAGGPSWAADGAAVYKEQCAKCHGDTGKADTAVAQMLKIPALAGDAHVQQMSAADVVAKIKGNEKHPAKVKSLSAADLDAAAAYAKQLAAGS